MSENAGVELTHLRAGALFTNGPFVEVPDRLC